MAIAAGVVVLVAVASARAQAAYVAKARVRAETRLDWAYPLTGKSQSNPPEGVLEGYRSAAQSYEFHGPDIGADGGPLPLVIFVSPSDRPVGWRFMEPVCRAEGIVFAGLHDMGNGKPRAQRIRAVLDVLDDVRDRLSIDPDRTYLAGFSGGADVACATAFALPEYLGGVVCIGHAPRPPEAPWLLRRVCDRLSLAIICGDHDPATPMVKDLLGPWWDGAGARLEQVTLEDHGHTMPGPNVFAAAFAWIDDGAAARRELARAYPSTRIADAPSPDEWARRVLSDAKARLERDDPAAIDAGLLQLEGLASRWPTTTPAAEATALLREYGQRAERPWEDVRAGERRRLVQLQAEGFDALAFDGRRPVKDQRGRHARRAIALWQQVREATEDAELMAVADERVAALIGVAAKAPAEAEPLSLRRVRFDMSGDVTLIEGLQYMRTALARVGYEMVVDEAALRDAGVVLDRMHHPRLRAATFEEVDRRFFRRAGVFAQRQDATVTILPVRAKQAAANVSRSTPSEPAR
jgi:dienelactone hydrolase